MKPRRMVSEKRYEAHWEPEADCALGRSAPSGEARQISKVLGHYGNATA